MSVSWLLREIHDLGVYGEAEWLEYLSFFDAEPLTERAAQVEAIGLGERIRRGHGRESSTALDDLARQSSKIRMEKDVPAALGGRMLGMVSGAFDLLHLGHLHTLRAAKAHVAEVGGALCVLTLPDEHIRAKKGPTRPVLGLDERVGLLVACRYVDMVVPLREPDCLGAIERLRPGLFFKTARDREQAIVRREIALVEALGGSVRELPNGCGRRLCTTAIIERQRAGAAMAEPTENGGKSK